jgi:sigma-B regulation protein RsbU (phosphoserine phosphatase)
MSAATTPVPTAHPLTVLLVDDQAIVGESIRRMLAPEADIRFHFCPDPARAIPMANEVGPTVILQDLVMPDIDGLMLVKFFRANTKTRDVPLIVLSSKEEPVIKAQAFAFGANDYLVKLPDKVELLARVRYHSRGYVALLERNEAFRKLAESQRQLAEEVGQAAKYVRSLLPPPLADARARVEWRFVPSTTLGGDSFGYNWLDPDHLAVYLLDVSGHGVGSSLMSVSAMNVISARTLPDTDFRNPGQVLQRLSSAFPMEKHNGLFFTIWYGVYDRGGRRLSWAGAGHPPALLFTGPDRDSAALRRLESQGPMIGLMEDLPYDTDSVDLGPYARLYVYSDGVFEIAQVGGKMWTIEEFVNYMASLPPAEGSTIDRLLAHARRLQGADVLGDDFSMVEIDFAR